MTLSNIVGAVVGAAVLVGSLVVFVRAERFTDYINETSAQLPRWRTVPIRRPTWSTRIVAVGGVVLGVGMLILGLTGSFA